MPLRAVFFDIDGTLVDSNALHTEAWHRAFTQAGYEVARGDIAGQIGMGADNLVPALLPGAPEEAADKLGDAHGTIFKRDYLKQVRPFAHAHDLVARVHDSGRRVVLASSASKQELEHYVELLGIADLVDASTTIDDVENSKPAPDIFAVARDKVGIDPSQIAVIGDAPYDMDAARKCGMARIAVRSGGFEDAALTEAGAQAIYDDVAALLTAFDTSPLAR